jgi:adenylate cyclase
MALLQGEAEEAGRLLGEAYVKFTEGFDTADLLEAKALLDEIESEGMEQPEIGRAAKS